MDHEAGMLKCTEPRWHAQKYRKPAITTDSVTNSHNWLRNVMWLAEAKRSAAAKKCSVRTLHFLAAADLFASANHITLRSQLWLFVTESVVMAGFRYFWACQRGSVHFSMPASWSIISHHQSHDSSRTWLRWPAFGCCVSSSRTQQKICETLFSYELCLWEDLLEDSCASATCISDFKPGRVLDIRWCDLMVGLLIQVVSVVGWKWAPYNVLLWSGLLCFSFVRWVFFTHCIYIYIGP